MDEVSRGRTKYTLPVVRNKEQQITTNKLRRRNKQFGQERGKKIKNWGPIVDVDTSIRTFLAFPFVH